VSAGCLNAGALMGAHINSGQIDRLKFMALHVAIRKITLFLDRDEVGRKGMLRAASLLAQNGFAVKTFDWDRKFERPGRPKVGINPLFKDPADMSGAQIKYLRKHEII
jgi:DNA primase